MTIRNYIEGGLIAGTHTLMLWLDAPHWALVAFMYFALVRYADIASRTKGAA